MQRILEIYLRSFHRSAAVCLSADHEDHASGTGSDQRPSPGSGLISDALPFWTDATWARVTIIVVNIWIGIPYTILQVTGILQNIPAELYESAKIDGAGPVTIFFKITLPYMLFVTTPYLITQFIGNINNFNVIYLLSEGGPAAMDYYNGTGGKTDLLVTWLYKLTIDFKDYNYGAVIGILTFVICATLALVTYRRTGSYKNRGGIPVMKSMKTKKRILITIVHVLLTVLAIIWVFPIFWVVMTSFRAGKGSYSTEFIPEELTVGNYIKLFTDTGVFDFPRMFMNTLIVAIVTCILATFFLISIAYTMSRMRFKMRKPYLNIALILGMFPGSCP